MTNDLSPEEELAQLKRELPPEVFKAILPFLAINDEKLETCPHCGAKIEEMKQVGRSVYGSCGCRLYQGFLPKYAK